MWEEVPDWGGVGARRLVRGREAALGASLWEFQPGGCQFVYHFHHGSEELLVVLRGEPTVACTTGTGNFAKEMSSLCRAGRRGVIRSGTRATGSPAY